MPRNITITFEDGTSHTYQNAPDALTPDAVQARAEKDFGKAVTGIDGGKQAEPKTTLLQDVKQQVGNLGAGLLRGAGSIGATLLTPIDAAARAMGVQNDFIGRTDRREAMDAGLRTMGADTDSYAYGGGKLAAEIAGTAGVGGVLAKGAAAVPQVAKYTPGLVDALRTGGFSAGGTKGAAGVATRVAGGGLGGAVSAGVVNPEDTGVGAAIGGAFPIVGQIAGKAGVAIGDIFRPENAKVAERIIQATGMSKSALQAVLANSGSPVIQNYKATVPQILQNPEISQLQRTLKTAGVNALGDAERLQQSQFMNALNSVAPINPVSTQDAAEAAGGAIQRYAVPARQKAAEQVRDAFDAVDPFNETALFLPIDQMKAAKSKFLGQGTFGTGSRAQQAIDTAQSVGTELIPGIKAMTQKQIGKGQSLEQAVRAMGGIKPTNVLAVEISELGSKQSGTTGLLNRQSGKSVDDLATAMYERGFIPDDDPATLVELLRNKGGRNVFANDLPESVMQGRLERAMGDLPEDQIVAKTVPFQTVQNLRSSLGEAAEQASAKGANKEAAALRQMVAEVDSRINRAAGGSADAMEYFPADIADQYRNALKLHEKKMLQFETGPQAGMFRKAGDGQAQIQGAEIPPKFYSGRGSQVDDVKAFKRLIGSNTDLADELKKYAMTQGANTTDSMGNLGQKYIDWVASRSGANRELLTPAELAKVEEVGYLVERSIKAEGLGRVSGSDTAQKLAALQSNGLLDNKLVDILANRIPVLGSFTGPALQNLRNTATKSRNEMMAKLLANPDELSSALSGGGGNMALEMALRKALPATYRTLPVLSSD